MHDGACNSNFDFHRGKKEHDVKKHVRAATIEIEGCELTNNLGFKKLFQIIRVKLKFFIYF